MGATGNCRNLYQLHLDGEVWQEPVTALFPVETELHKPSGGVRLLTTARQIHRTLQESNIAGRST